MSPETDKALREALKRLMNAIHDDTIGIVDTDPIEKIIALSALIATGAPGSKATLVQDLADCMAEACGELVDDRENLKHEIDGLTGPAK